MKRKWKHWAICAAIAIGSTASARLLSNIQFFQLLNLKALDEHFVVRGQQPTSNIFLVTADEKALNAFPEPIIFWQPYYADAIRAASENGAKVIGLDHAFGIPVEKWYPDNDRKIAEAVANATAAGVPVICATVDVLNQNPLSAQIPLNIMAAGLGLDAFVNLTMDPDDFARRQELIEAPGGKDDPPPHRSIAFRVAEKYLGKDAEFDHGRLMLEGHLVPDRTITINYAGPPGTFPRVSLADFLEAANRGDHNRLRSWVNGKAVLIGADNTSDRYATPFYNPLDPKRSLTAGVEIHANALQTVLNRSYLLAVPEAARITVLLLATAGVAAIVTELSSGYAIGALAFELALILATTHFVFRAGWILPTAELVLAGGLCVVASYVYNFFTSEKRRRVREKAIELFVGKRLVSELEQSERVGLTGKTLRVTILFTDIRGFTAYSEKVCQEEGPEVLVQLLNEYMAQMVAIIVRYHGQVNKFIGDGILAIFCDEDEGAVPGDHALRCVRCATEMVTAKNRFSTGAGIHTGTAVVGNVGSADKMEYTVLGDTVNLASRLESLNKEHHTKLLMSEATEVELNGQVDVTYLAAVPVRGKAAPISLYTVTSLVPEPAAVVHA